VIETLQVRLPAGALPGSLGQLGRTTGVGKSNTSLLAGVKSFVLHTVGISVEPTVQGG